MQKKLIIGGAIAFVVGIIILWVSPTMGVSLANGQIPMEGMDTDVYNGLMRGYINAIRTAGGIIAFLGGLEAILAFYFYPAQEKRKSAENQKL